jgi:anti-sigma B factor antagonist
MPDIEEPAELRATDFAVEQRTEGADVVLTVSGELDLSSAPELERALAESGAGRAQRVVIDLAQLTFMDSTGVSVLVRAKQEADAAGRVLAVRHPNGQVRRLLELVGLLGRLDVED